MFWSEGKKQQQKKTVLNGLNPGARGKARPSIAKVDEDEERKGRSARQVREKGERGHASRARAALGQG